MWIAVIGTRFRYLKITTFLVIFLCVVEIVTSIVSFGSDEDDQTTKMPTVIPQTTRMSRAFKGRLICLTETFGSSTSSRSLYWNDVEVGQISITNRPCLQSNGLPLIRKCILDENQSPTLEKISQNPSDCITRTKEKLITNNLAELAEEVMVTNKTQPADAIKRLKHILQADDFKLIPTDVYYASTIVEQAVVRATTPELCLDLLSIYNRLMGADKKILWAATVFNSTNKLLSDFEMCIDSTSRQISAQPIPAEDQIEEMQLAALGVRAHLAENVSVFHIDPEKANVTGIALYKQPGHRHGINLFREVFGDLYYRFLYSDEAVEYLLNENGLEMASYIPYDLWKNLTQKLPHPASLIIKVYSNDALFNEARLNTTRKVFSRIASLTIPGLHGSFQTLLPMIFRIQDMGTSKNHSGTGCGYWNYNTWVSDGIELIQDNLAHNSLIACGTHHMTQFAYLIGGVYRYSDATGNFTITKLNMRVLNIITLVGCSLSMVGLLGIYITSIVFKPWRSKASSKILLHMCTAIVLQMILFCFVNTHDMIMYLMQHKNYIGCVVVGALLQYSVLVEFSWMLIIAFFQFQRYVQVFGTRPRHFVLKSAILGWGLPIISPAVLIAVDRASYVPFDRNSNSMVCYPSGNGLNLGVLLPVGLIILTNLVIFVMVVWSIHHTLEVPSRRDERKIIFQQIRLMVMMFFLFGFSWIFGLLAAMDAGVAFSYLFCITATLQGFVLFVYFVILDPETRKLWYQIYWNADSKVKESETARLGTSS